MVRTARPFRYNAYISHSYIVDFEDYADARIEDLDAFGVGTIDIKCGSSMKPAAQLDAASSAASSTRRLSKKFSEIQGRVHNKYVMESTGDVDVDAARTGSLQARLRSCATDDSIVPSSSQLQQQLSCKFYHPTMSQSREALPEAPGLLQKLDQT